jgi:hypothetical protein
VAGLYHKFCKEKADLLWQDEASLKIQVEAASQNLQLYPEDPGRQARYGHLWDSLQALEERKVVGKRIRARTKWRLRGDMVSKAFFLAVKEKPAWAAITELQDANGVFHHDRPQLDRICTKFYSKLYKEPEPSPDQG